MKYREGTAVWMFAILLGCMGPLSAGSVGGVLAPGQVTVEEYLRSVSPGVPPDVRLVVHNNSSYDIWAFAYSGLYVTGSSGTGSSGPRVWDGMICSTWDTGCSTAAPFNVINSADFPYAVYFPTAGGGLVALWAANSGQMLEPGGTFDAFFVMNAALNSDWVAFGQGGTVVDRGTIGEVPEPAGWALMAGGLVGMLGLRRRR